MKFGIQAFIFARGGSKGIPKKNIYELCGKPLIAYSIETALNSHYITDVIVSTDDPEIATVSEKYGAIVPFIRPEFLATDSANEWNAWQHAIKHTLKYKMFDTFVSLPATAPLRTVEDVNGAIKKFINSKCDMLLTGSKSKRHPMFNMVKETLNGQVCLLMPPKQQYCRRQETDVVYDLTTVAYVGSVDYILNHNGLFEGQTVMYEVPPERALDIDDSNDMQIAEAMLLKGLGCSE